MSTENASADNPSAEIVLVGPMMPYVMEALDGAFTLHRLWEARDRAAMLADLSGRARGIGTMGQPVGRDLLDALPRVEIVANFGVGVDNIDLAAAAARKVIVTNTPDVLNDDVANLAIALLLDCSRGVTACDRHVRAGRWPAGGMPLTRGIRGRRMGILGLGRIGKDIAEKARVFGMEIAYHGRRRQNGVAYRFYPDLVALARDSDVLVAICPGGEATRNLVNRPVLDALGPEGTLINVARGSVVDEPELVAALRDGRLGAAGLDVFADEPRVPEALLAMENVVLQPHMGSATVETRRAMGDLVVENLRRHFAGKGPVTPVR